MKLRIQRAIERIQAMTGTTELLPPSHTLQLPTRFEHLYKREAQILSLIFKCSGLPEHYDAAGRVWVYNRTP